MRKAPSALLLTTALLLAGLCAVPPAGFLGIARGAPDEDGRIATIDSYVAEQMRANRIPGLSVGILENGKVVYLRGFGRADSDGRQVTPETPFIIGSMSKSFTALAVMQLVEAGKLELDMPVKEYIPWFSLSDPEASAQITVRHLLNQTSGIPNSAGMRELVGTGEKTLEQAVRELSRYELLDPPGTRFQYSNSNFTVSGLLVETVSGEPYGEYVGRHIFEPLEMRNSFTSQTEAKKHGMSAGYRRVFGFPVSADLPYRHQEIPAGLIISCAEDMTHYLIANMNEGVFEGTAILSPEGVAELHRPAVRAVTGDYGLGWLIEYVSGNPTILHHGSTANFHSTMLIEPDTERGIVVLTNVGLFELWHLGPSKVIVEGIASLLRGDSPADYGLGIGDRYLITDTIIGLLMALLVGFAALLPRWRRHLVAQPPKGSVALARRVILPIAVDFSWPLAVLVGFPVMTHTPSWSYWLLYEPDFACWLIAVASLTLVKAGVRVWLSHPVLRPLAGGVGKRGILTSAVICELVFLVALFVVMFTSVGPASFVIVLLAAALLFEIIALPGHLMGIDRSARGQAQDSPQGAS